MNGATMNTKYYRAKSFWDLRRRYANGAGPFFVGQSADGY